MRKFQTIISLVSAIVVGPLCLYISYLMISDIPGKNELLWLASTDITEVRYAEEDGLVSKIRLFNQDGYCLSVRENKEGFSQLLDAVRKGNDYSIGYNKERMMFSDSPKLFTVIYEIEVSGDKVKSYRKHVQILWLIFGAIGVFGTLLTGWLFYAPYNHLSVKKKTIELTNKDRTKKPLQRSSW